ncbi:hypothetical protein Hamer_G016037 [Homarus americanus]|uniref:Uncharacterized protein n=1 Tax=Homarus americanus TaxID=6706 RepID=A0A8J5MLI7_HOMAM|nr:hypothetical protein Hamer_G016037 [Homarus americanus]
MIKAPPITTPTAPSVGIIGGSGGAGGLSPLSSPSGGKQGEPTPTAIVLSARSQRSPGSSCRVCVKTLKDSEFFKVCSECGNKVCEDCASYSTHSSDGEQCGRYRNPK